MAIPGKSKSDASRIAGASAVIEAAPATDLMEVSVVIPCLNEANSVGACIDKAFRAFAAHNLMGEVIVADNGSTDGSIEIAEARGARVVKVEVQGYGAALQEGIRAARGRFIIMGDADESYDFSEVPQFLEKWREGYDVVMGNRFQGGIPQRRGLQRHQGGCRCDHAGTGCGVGATPYPSECHQPRHGRY